MLRVKMERLEWADRMGLPCQRHGAPPSVSEGEAIGWLVQDCTGLSAGLREY